MFTYRNNNPINNDGGSGDDEDKGATAGVYECSGEHDEYEDNENENYEDDDTNNNDNDGDNDLLGMTINIETEKASMEYHEIPGVSQDVIQDDETNHEAQSMTSYEITGVSDEEIPGVSGQELQSTSASSNDNGDDESNGEDDAGNVETPDDEIYHPYTTTPSIQRIHGIRPKKPRDYSHIHANIVHHTITQYSLNRV
jgi:hypothetical protein